MNILNLLTKEKRVAGIEIDERVIRIAYFRLRKKKLSHLKIEPPNHELILIEEPIGANIISQGRVINEELLGKTLKEIWERAKLTANYAIVSIPENSVYSHVFSYPKTVNDSHLNEAVNLTIDFQLPFKKTDFYIGWENAGDSHTVNDVLISAMPINIANGYIKALNNAGIKMLALESHLASIARSIKTKLGQTVIFTKKSLSGSTIFILKDSMIRFSRTLPSSFLKTNDAEKNELNRIKTSYESEKRVQVFESSLSSSPVRDEYLRYPELDKNNLEMQAKWLVALGAAIRGELPKGHDNHISLLPVGTAEAYAYQQATTFIELMRNMLIGVSIFFLVAFFAAYLLIFSLYQTALKNNSSISASPIDPDVVQKENWINKVNLLTNISKNIVSNSPNWSILLSEIHSKTIPGINITNLSINNVLDPINITGTASDRNTLNQFKKSIQESSMFNSINLPITNLEQKTDIPFSITFKLKDPNVLYLK